MLLPCRVGRALSLVQYLVDVGEGDPAVTPYIAYDVYTVHDSSRMSS